MNTENCDAKVFCTYPVDMSDATDFTIERFVEYFTKHKDSYQAKFKKEK